MGLFSKRKDESLLGDPTPPTSADRATTEAFASRHMDMTGQDPSLAQKKRARRRLVGAIALALAAIIVLPMVFDPEPKPLSDDIQIQIPAQNTPLNKAPEPSASAANTTSSPSNTHATNTSPATETTTPATPQAAPSTPTASNNSVPTTGTKPESPTPSTTTKPSDTGSTASDKKTAAQENERKEGERKKAEAALAGKLDPAESKAETKAEQKTEKTTEKPNANETGKFVLQLGVFSNPEKVKQLQEKLSKAGVKTYTESLQTDKGPRTRVRVGPFNDRASAEKMREKVQQAGFSSILVSATKG